MYKSKHFAHAGWKSEEREYIFDAETLATVLLFPLFPGNVPSLAPQQVVVRQLGGCRVGRVTVFFPVLGILELTKEETGKK